jgi:hypothetical protein
MVENMEEPQVCVVVLGDTISRKLCLITQEHFSESVTVPQSNNKIIKLRKLRFQGLVPTSSRMGTACRDVTFATTSFYI